LQTQSHRANTERPFSLVVPPQSEISSLVFVADNTAQNHSKMCVHIERPVHFQNIFYIRENFENLKFKKSRRPKIKKSKNQNSKTQLLDSKFETFQILRINF
jgi:hypothetical protein